MARIPNDIYNDGKKYIGAYLLDIDDRKEKFLVEFENVRKLKEYVILDREVYAYKNYTGQLNVIDNPCVEEWLALIKYSEVFVTDSFHGMCFAIIFQKDFYVIFEKDSWRGFDRIYSFLGEIGLLERLIIIGETEKVSTVTIDYTRVNSILQKKILESKNWIKETLEEAKTYVGKATEYDIFLEELYKNKALMSKNAQDICIMKAEIYFQKNSRIQIKGETLYNMDRVIVGFGIGNNFNRNIEKVKKSCNMSYITDNSPDKWDKEFQGIKCIQPKQLTGFSNIYVIIFVDDVGISFDIAKQLMDMGVYNFDHINNFLKEVE